jgi:flagellar hook-associated protein 1 FlgK
MAGGGVRIDGIAQARDRFADRRLWTELPAEQREAAMADMLARVEVALGGPGASIDARLAQLFDAFARLADQPTSATARQEVILQGQNLALAFRDMTARFSAAQRDADLRVAGAVDEINQLAARIASLNQALGNAPPASGEGLHLRDEVRTAVEALSRLVAVEVIERPDGGFDVAVGSGRALVVGGTAWPLAVAPRSGTGLADIVAHDGTIITAELGSGQLGGLIRSRDVLIPSYQAALDELAYAVATEINTLHTAGYDAAGAAGQAFFAPPAGVSGAAGTLALNPALLAAGGEALVAASGDAAEPADNATARALAALRDRRVLAGGTATMTDAWSRLVYAVGRDAQASREAARTRGEIVQQVRTLQDSVSGVSLDEEAANLLRFQRAYEANARFFRAIDDALTTLMQMVGA